MFNPNKMKKVLSILIISLSVFLAAHQVFAQGGSWETKTPMPTARWTFTTGAIDGMIYAAGG